MRGSDSDGDEDEEDYELGETHAAFERRFEEQALRHMQMGEQTIAAFQAVHATSRPGAPRPRVSQATIDRFEKVSADDLAENDKCEYLLNFRILLFRVSGIVVRHQCFSSSYFISEIY